MNKEWKELNDKINEYDHRKLKELLFHFFNEDSIKNLIRLNHALIYKIHKVKEIDFSGKIFCRIKEVKFDEEIGEYYLIVQYGCSPHNIKTIYDYEKYFYSEDIFDNENVQKLRAEYKQEDSIKERKEITKRMSAISSECNHYFVEDEFSDDLICKKCSICVDKQYGITDFKM